ncbi:hypothetical protein K2173_010493 [Erythroxylum novogranatense]|uniref:Heparan-alpha-glucosaminide N-acetyltransferase catalytic domain-containing protein n=1 Tax=Erythroxylum novogranatense TaxID=1862640 RepID=A0AAV8TDX8_9ROSI|nr:hypothetical protein K2173_010493 [Erythroxylum novogranatense]
MAEYQPLIDNEEQPPPNKNPSRVASLDVFRGLCVSLMMLVDYGGSIFPVIAHAPWNGLHLADLVMPFFLFVAGVSLALVYKKVSNRVDSMSKAVLRAVKLFLLGVLLQGGFFHGINSLTYGVDIERIRWLGILQRIAIGYIIAALCAIWLSSRTQSKTGFLKIFYYWQWGVALALSAIYLSLLYGLFVPDWQFEISAPTYTLPANSSYIFKVKCSVRGDLGPSCNAAGMIDRYVIGIGHLYGKPVYRNLQECNMSSSHQVSENSPPWCHAPFDPEGLLSSLTAAVACIIGLQYGHILAHIQDHKARIENWSVISLSLFVLGLLIAFSGIPVNKSLYTISYMLITSASAGITFSALYLLVDVYGYRRLTYVFEWMGVHALSIFIVVTSNLAIIAIQGFYRKAPQDNLIRWIVSFFVHP